MTDKIHLQYCFLCSHRLEREGLNSDFEFTLLDVLIVIIFCDNKGIGFNLFLKSGLILSDLSFEALDCPVKSCYEGIALFFTSEGRTSIVYGNFDYLHPFTHLTGYEGFGLFSEELIELQKLLFNCRLE